MSDQIEEPKLVSVKMTEAGLEFRMKHPIVPTIASFLAEAFRDAGGVNYVAFDIDHEEIGPLTLIMQRRWGKTPENIAAELRARVDELESALRFYANPEIYKPHPHGPAFERRDLSFLAVRVLSPTSAPPPSPEPPSPPGSRATSAR